MTEPVAGAAATASDDGDDSDNFGGSNAIATANAIANAVKKR